MELSDPPILLSYKTPPSHSFSSLHWGDRQGEEESIPFQGTNLHAQLVIIIDRS
jgi:hypothetical protein